MSQLPPKREGGNAGSTPGKAPEGGDAERDPIPATHRMVVSKTPASPIVGGGGGVLPGMSVEAAAQVRAPITGTYVPRAAMPSAHPRKVKGGIKISTKTGPVSGAWSAHRWMRLVEDLSGANAMAEGLAYARSAQTRSITIAPGRISAVVQGRMPYPYNVEIVLPTLTGEQWDKVLTSMLEEARHLAGLLGGEVPPNIEDLFKPLRLRLFPQEQHDLVVSCTCGQCGNGGVSGAAQEGGAAGTGGWCKHVACAMAIVGERLGADTFLMFQLRGMGREELLDELRSRRASMGKGAAAGEAGPLKAGVNVAGMNAAMSAARPVPAYLPRLPGVSDVPSKPLDACVEDFWSAPSVIPGVAETSSALADLDLTMTPPAVSHPLLRRLGPSPFDASTGAKFPLVGLLATCYDLISEHALRGAAGPSADATVE